MSFDSIPQEMRAYPQWVVWRYEQRDGSDKPTKNLYSPQYGYQASVNAPGTWGTFDEAVSAFGAGGCAGIGFVFTDSDPFFGIDLDDTEGDEADFDRQRRVFDTFPTYAERSPSGKGLHLIGRGALPGSGRRRSKIEVYSSDRFFTMTGNVYRDAPIADCHDQLQVLWNAMRPVNDRADDGFNGPEREPDTAVVERMFAAANGEKARDLHEGHWQKHYASQSEADFAFVDIAAFYSDNRAQIARIFHASALGQRKKAGRDDYVARMLARVFDRRIPPVDTATAIANAKAFIEAQIAADTAGLPTFDMPADDALPTVDVSAFDGRDVTPRAWLVDSLIPAGNITLLQGDGGSGKSQIAAQLCASTVLGRNWIGSDPIARGNALYVSAEDDLPEVHRRMADIARYEGVSMRDLRGLAVVSLADRDALLAVPGRARGTLEPTPLYAALAARIAALRPALIVIDTLADTFGGNEIDRAQARQFIAHLRRLAIEFATTIVVLAHPSQSGMASGSGTSGSTGWSNSVRSRLYLRRDEQRPDVRILELMKSNYGAIGQQIELQWDRGVFHKTGGAENKIAYRQASEHVADDIFMRILSILRMDGKTVSRVPQSVDYAPKIFAKRPEAGMLDKRDFVQAMERLFANNRICEEYVGEYQSKKKRVIGVTSPAEPTSNMSSNSISSEFPGSSNSAENRASNIFQLVPNSVPYNP